MESPPEFWRTVVFHPLSVHFPIVLTLLTTLFTALGLLNRKSPFLQAAYLLVWLTAASTWLAVYTGNLADGEVARTLCDPTVLKDHENAAYVIAWLTTAATALATLHRYRLILRFQRWLRLSVFVLLLLSSGYVAYVGHLGARLVYQQAAGVYQPSEDCREFR